jgi:hypothetical protein
MHDICNNIREKIIERNIESKAMHHAFIFNAKRKVHMQNRLVYCTNNDWPFYNISSTHAEMGAIEKIRCCKNLPKQLDMLVVKIDCLGNLCHSKPCYHCLQYIKKTRMNIRYVYYSTPETIVKEKFVNLLHDKNQHICYGMRKT